MTKAASEKVPCHIKELIDSSSFSAASLQGRPAEFGRASMLEEVCLQQRQLEDREDAIRNSKITNKSAVKERYDGEFYEYVYGISSYKGCAPVLYPQGITFKWLRLPPGLFEDMLLYVFNTNDFVKCFMCERDSPVTRGMNRVVFVATYSIAFFVTTLVNSSIAHGDVLTSVNRDFVLNYLAPIANICFIAPLVGVFKKISSRALAWLLSMQCFSTETWQQKYASLLLRNLSGLIILLSCAALLLVSALLTVTRPDPQRASEERTQILQKYALQVHLLSFLGLFAEAALRFVPQFHINILVFETISILEVGCWFLEHLISSGKRQGKDWEISRLTCCCILRFEVVTLIAPAKLPSTSNTSPMHEDFPAALLNRNSAVAKARSTIVDEIPEPLEDVETSASDLSSVEKDVRMVPSIGTMTTRLNPAFIPSPFPTGTREMEKERRKILLAALSKRKQHEEEESSL